MDFSPNNVSVIYWINLDRSVDRRKRMETMFQDPMFNGIEIIRFSAVDGSKVNIDDMIDVKEKTMNPNEYGCLLSHMEVIRTFSNQSNHQMALIMEDDATLEFKPHWKDSLNGVITDSPMGWECLMLSYIANDIPDSKFTFNENKYWSTLAYVITLNGAKRFTDSHYSSWSNKYKTDPDTNNEADQYIFQKLVTYVYKYPIFIYSYGEDSTLHQGAVSRHDQSKKRVEDMYNGKTPDTTPQQTINWYIVFFAVVAFIVFIFVIATVNIWGGSTRKLRGGK